MSDFFECPVCGRTPKISTYSPDIASATCRGYAFHHHKRIGVTIMASPSVLYKELANHWNQIHFREARFLFDDEREIDRIMGKACEGQMPKEKTNAEKFLEVFPGVESISTLVSVLKNDKGNGFMRSKWWDEPYNETDGGEGNGKI